jgi:hypothetical protein
MTTRLGLALALLSAAPTAFADPPGVADFVKQVEGRKGKVVLDGKGVPAEVYLYNKAFSDDDLALLKPFPGLKVLNVQHARITDAGVEKAVAAHPAIETINLHDTLVTPACVKDLAKLKALHTIEIFGRHVTDDLVRELRAHGLLHLWRQAGTWTAARPRSPADVRSLALEFTAVTTTGLKGFADFKALTYISGIPADDATLRALAEMKLLHTHWLADEGATWDRRPRSAADVARFGLRRPNRVTAEGLKELRAFTGLKTLDLHEFHANPDALKVIASFKSLETLRLGPTTADAGLDELAALPRLQVLELYGSGVTDAGLEQIGRIKSLRRLNVTGTKVTAAGLKHLRGLSLTRLDLSPALLTDEALQDWRDKKMVHTLGIARGKVGKLASDEDIVFLILAKAPITDSSVKLLAEMKTLTGVDLSGTRVTEKGVAELKAALPKLYVRR